MSRLRGLTLGLVDFGQIARTEVPHRKPVQVCYQTWTEKKGGINDQEWIHTGTNHQQAT